MKMLKTGRYNKGQFGAQEKMHAGKSNGGRYQQEYGPSVCASGGSEPTQGAMPKRTGYAD